MNNILLYLEIAVSIILIVLISLFGLPGAILAKIGVRFFQAVFQIYLFKSAWGK
jgi:hypothetical protein